MRRETSWNLKPDCYFILKGKATVGSVAGILGLSALISSSFENLFYNIVSIRSGLLILDKKYFKVKIPFSETKIATKAIISIPRIYNHISWACRGTFPALEAALDRQSDMFLTLPVSQIQQPWRAKTIGYLRVLEGELSDGVHGGSFHVNQEVFVPHFDKVKALKSNQNLFCLIYN